MPKKKSNSKSKPKPKLKKRDKSVSSQEALQLAAESRTALSVTVAWTLALMATLAAEAIGVLCQGYVRLVEANDVVVVLGVVMLFVALVSGCVTLLLTPLTVRMAKTRPPRSLVQLAYVAGVLPLVTLVLQYIISQ